MTTILQMNQEDLRTIRYSIAALGAIADEKSLPLLEQYLSNENEHIKQDAKNAISNIKSKMVRLPPHKE